WRKLLKGFTSPTALNLDRLEPSDTVRPYEQQEAQLRLSSETTAALMALARQRQLTLNTLAQGAWAILLSYYSNSSDVVFGAVVSGRPPELITDRSIVGLFINTLPVRVRVEGDQTLIPWLKLLQQQQAKTRQFEFSFLADIQGWSEMPRGMPLF